MKKIENRRGNRKRLWNPSVEKNTFNVKKFKTKSELADKYI